MYSYEYYAPDNSVRISHTLPEYKAEWGYGEVSAHNAKPKKLDLVDWDGRRGHILYIRKEYDEVHVFFYDTKDTEDFPLNSFYNYTRNASGRATWQI